MASTVHVTKAPVNVDVHGNEKQPPGVFISNVDIFHGGEGIVAARGIVIAGGRAKSEECPYKKLGRSSSPIWALNA